MPKGIKTKTTVKDIKLLHKTVSGTAHMKNAFIRSKTTAEETQSQGGGTPESYASDKVTSGAQNISQSAANRLRHTKAKAAENLNKAKEQFKTARQQAPKARKAAAEQAQKAAETAKSTANNLGKTAEKAGKVAKEANTAVVKAKETLQQTRIEGRQSVRTAKQTMQQARQAGRQTVQTANQTARVGRQAEKGVKTGAKGTVKTVKKTVKTAEHTARTTVKTAKTTAKTAQKTAQATAKAARISARAARAAAKTAATATKAAAKGVAALVKAAIAAIKALIAAIAAGGWIALLIIILVCLIGLLIGSIFGIFFSSEPDPESGMTVNSVMREINTEYTDELDRIKAANPHDLLDVSGTRAGWKSVLTVYTVRTVSDPDNPMEVATMTAEKAEILRKIFWEINTISYTLETETVTEDVLGDDGLPTGETAEVSRTVLRIVVSHKTPEEMAAQYGFDDTQNEWLAELQKPEYRTLWNGLLYGITSIGDGSMIEVAESQIGNIGGEPYWSWYGWSSRVAWCACFVSWCAEQCGYIDADIIPMFAYCPFGIAWFVERGQWQDSSYTPNPGDIIFFDWEGDGESDHVGIVENVEGGIVNTIEGNTSDSVARRSYTLGSAVICGYGIPLYNQATD
jgi:hypothetical protein